MPKAQHCVAVAWNKIESLEFVMSKLNLADHLTKSLNRKLVEETSRGMRLVPIIEVKSDRNPTY